MEPQRPYRVCLYCDHWQNGGVEAYLMNLLRHWDFERLNCELVVSQAETDLYDGELQALGVRRVVTLPKTYSSPILRIARNLLAVRKQWREQRYDAVYLNLSNSFTMMYAWLAKRAGIAVRVVHSHCAGIKPSATRPLKQLAHAAGRRLFAPCATQRLACSELAGRWMFGQKAWCDGSVRLVHNAVDTLAFTKRPEERERERKALGVSDRWVVGTVGRLTEQKNPLFFLDAFSRLTKLRGDAFLLWIGEGELLKEARARAGELGVLDSVLFYGATRRVPQMLWVMDAFCLPSLFEGNPVSVIEAQAAGCACLVSDTVTKQCKVSENVRFLPIDQGADVWAQAMRDARPACGFAEAAQQVRANGYDAREMSAQVQKLFEDALWPRRSRMPVRK